MKNRTRTLVSRLQYATTLAAISAALILLSFPLVTVTNAQTETETPAPGAGGDPGGPAAPVLNAASNPGWIRLSWEPVAGAGTYDVWWRYGSDGNWRRAESSPISGTGSDFIGTREGTVLYFLVRSIAADGKVSPWSDLAQATAIARLTPTPTPTSTVTGNLPAPILTATSSGTNAVDISWTAVTGAVRYELWAWDSASSWQQLDDGNLTGRTHRHEDVTPGSTYYYTVRAVAADGTASPWSDQKFVTVPNSPQPLAAPTLTAQATMASTVELRWNSVSGAVRYELWAWDSASGWQQLDDGNLTGTAHTHTELSPGTIYYYSIRAVGATGATSVWSDYAEATVSTTTEPHTCGYSYTNGYRYTESYCHPDSDLAGPRPGCREDRPAGALPGNRRRQLDE